ncbi:rpb-11, partial [Symbiodinium sp. KB8]
MKLDEKMTNAATFTLKREDHTLGNLLRTQLLRDPQVHFSGYLHPHPLDHDIILKVQTTSHSRPAEAVARSAMQLQGVYAQMLRCMREHV